jgi:hypothetical protein
MSDAVISARPSSGLSFGTATAILLVVLILAIPACWAAGSLYGVDKGVASNAFWVIFSAVYAGILALPWLALKGQEHLSRAQRLEKMCVVWICLTVGPHLTWELPWVVFYDAIMAGKGQLWSYAWWAYMDGGDMRYVTRDVYLLAMETGASLIGITGAVILYRRRKTGRFSDNQLLVLMALMVADFYPTYMYYVTEIHQGLPNVSGVTNLIVKFILANIFWLVMPWVVFIWAGRQLAGRRPNAAL